MPKSSILSTYEQENIIAYHNQNLFTRAIVKKIFRSLTVIINFLKDPDGYKTKRRGGKKRVLTTKKRGTYKKVSLLPSNTSVK